MPPFKIASFVTTGSSGTATTEQIFQGCKFNITHIPVDEEGQHIKNVVRNDYVVFEAGGDEALCASVYSELEGKTVFFAGGDSNDFIEFIRLFGRWDNQESGQTYRSMKSVRFVHVNPVDPIHLATGVDLDSSQRKSLSKEIFEIVVDSDHAQYYLDAHEPTPKAGGVLPVRALKSSSRAKPEQLALFTNAKKVVLLLAAGLAVLATTLSIEFGTSMFVTAGLESMVTAYAVGGLLCLAGLAMATEQFWPKTVKSSFAQSPDDKVGVPVTPLPKTDAFNAVPIPAQTAGAGASSGAVLEPDLTTPAQ